MNRMFTPLATCQSAHPCIRNMLLMLSMTLGFISLACLPAQAAVYRWVDDDGVIHFSQTSPHQPGSRPQRLTLNHRLMARMPAQPDGALPDRIVAGYCREIRGRTEAEARRMLDHKGLTARHRRLLTEADDQAAARVHKQLIHHVLGYRNAEVSADEIATLAMNQCLNGLYQDDIESWVRREHPDQHEALYR